MTVRHQRSMTGAFRLRFRALQEACPTDIYARSARHFGMLGYNPARSFFDPGVYAEGGVDTYLIAQSIKSSPGFRKRCHHYAGIIMRQLSLCSQVIVCSYIEKKGTRMIQSEGFR